MNRITNKFFIFCALIILFVASAPAQVPGPQIPLTGSVGIPGSAAVLGYFPISMTSDANHALTSTEWANHVLLVTSTVSLTTSRSLIAPNNPGQDFIIQNKTTGGQSIQIIGTSGTGISIANGQSVEVFFDGTNYTNGSQFTPGTNVGDEFIWNGTAYVPRYPRINSATNIINIGDSNCIGLGNTIRARSFCNIIDNTIGSNVINNEAISGATVADMFIGTLYGNENTPSTQPCYNSNLWVEAFGTNNAARQTPTAAVQTAYLQESMGVVIATGLCSPDFITPQTVGLTVTGSNSIQTFRNSTQWINLTSANSSVSFSITTDGSPIYITSLANETDTGTQSVTIDGASSPAVDTITNLSILPNTLFGGTDINNSFFLTQTPMLQRYPVLAGTHTVTFNCITPGTNGCGFFNASTKLHGSLPIPYIEPTILLYGVIPEQNDALSANTTAFDLLNKQTATITQRDGFNIYFADVHQEFLNNLSAFMGSVDIANPTGTTLTDATVSLSSPNTITSPSHVFGIKDKGKDIYVEGAGPAGATLYTTISNVPSSFGHTATLTAPAVTAVTNAITYVGWLGQICPASQNTNLHMTDCASLYMAKVGMSLLQAVSSPPPLSLYLNAGQSYNINGLNITSALTTGLPNPSFLVANTTSGPYGMRLGGDGTNLFVDLFAPASNANGIRMCNQATLTSAAVNCGFKFSRTGAVFTQPLSMSGEQVLSNIFTSPNIYGTPTTVAAQTILNDATAAGINNLLLPAGGIVSAIQTITGVGMTPGVYTVNASTGSAQGTFVVTGPTVANIGNITATGAGYVTAPTFTVPTGTTQPVFTGVMETPIAGQRYTFKKIDSSANLVTISSGAGTLDGVTGGSISLTQNQAATVWYDATTGWNTESLYQAGSGTVNSVFGRTGTITSATNDYNFSQIAGTIASAQVPVLNQSTTGTASNITGIVAVANGGTGSSPTAANQAWISSAAGAGSYRLIPNAALANPSTTVNAQSCVLGSTCTVTAVPSGAAGGDLVGSTYPNPVISKLNGITIGNSPTAVGQVPTAQAGLASLLWQTPASNFTPNQNITYLSTNCGILTNCITVHGDVNIDPTANWTSASSTVNTSSTAPPFLSTDCTGGAGCTGTTNKKIFGTGNCTGINITCDVQVPIGTISSFVNAHQITISTTTSAACTGSFPTVPCNLLWGTDDTVALQAGLTAALASNGQLQLPCANMFFNAPVFITPASQPHTFPLSIKGSCSLGSTLLIPTPDFAFGSSTNVLLIDSLPFSSNSADDFEDFSVYGAGEIFATLPPSNSTVMTFSNAYVKNVAILGLNWNQNVSGFISDGNVSLNGVISHGAGNTACVFNLNVTTLSNGSLCNETNSMQINSGAIAISHGTTWQGFLTLTGTGSVFESFGDIGNVNSNILLSGTGDLLVEDGWLNTNALGGVITLQNNSLANVSNSTLSGILNQSTSNINLNNSTLNFMQMTGGTAKVSNSIFNNTGASTPAPALTMPSGSPKFMDEGGNTFSSSFASTVSNVSGAIVSQNMLQGTCTGTATPASTLFMYGLGSSTLTTCTNTTLQGGKVMNKAGTLTNLTCTAGTAGLASDTCTVVKNGTPTSLTCTFASATCQDTTTAHYVTYAPNDIIAIQVTSGLADTLANVGTQVWAQ